VQRKQSKRLLLLSMAGLMVAGLSQASVLYSAPPNQSGGSDLNGFVEADDFTFAASAQITQIKFWSFQGSALDYSGSIAWSINSNASGVPGASVAFGSASPSGVATGQSGFGLSEFSYTFAVNVPLAAGTYWLTLHNGPTANIPATDFFWEWSNGNAGNSQSRDLSLANSPWLGNFAELAMELQGTGASSVPEPGSMFLLSAGLAGMWFVRARKIN
jgi:PEP-CTERM motif